MADKDGKRVDALSKLGWGTAKTRRILPAPEDPKGMHYLRRVGRFRQGPDAALERQTLSAWLS